MGALWPAQAQEPEETPQTARPIENIYVWGRATRMLGSADSGSQGIVGNADFSTRPMMRVGELVEVVPGMIATQHSGPGKANQYFLRGMNLDHGSDFTGLFEGMPVNFPSHAHATGYLDLNFMIPEVIEQVEFQKGTYYAQNGDFSAAGAARFSTYNRVDQGYVKTTVGNFDHQRVVGVGSIDTGGGSLLFAGEAQYRDGPWTLEQDVEKYNAFLKYSGNILGIPGEIMFIGYDSEWTSTDQIPLREVASGDLSRFGFTDADLGGESSLYSLIGNFTLKNTDLNLYASRYRLNLFSNPTLYLADPVNGDEIEQADSRWVYGASVKHGRDFDWGKRVISPRIGIDLRYDDAKQVALFNTRGRERIGVTRDDGVDEISVGLYGESTIQWTPSFRTTVGVRGEIYSWDVNARRAENSGAGTQALVLPKFAAAWSPAPGYEIYANYGHGFHSNDVRGAEVTVDPATGDPADPVDTLVRAEGAEFGFRAEPAPGLKLTLAYFWLELDSELVFVGDAGTSEPKGPSRRRGLEFDAFWEVNDWLVLDGNVTANRSRFTGVPAGANRVPNALEATANAGITVVHPGGFTASLHMRHFGEAPLEESDSVRQDATILFNLGLNYRFGKHLELGLDILNLFDTQGDDISFFFESQLPDETAPVADVHFHPVESRAYRANIKYKF